MHSISERDNDVIDPCRFKEQIYDIYRYLPPETQASTVVGQPWHIMHSCGSTRFGSAAAAAALPRVLQAGAMPSIAASLPERWQPPQLPA